MVEAFPDDQCNFVAGDIYVAGQTGPEEAVVMAKKYAELTDTFGMDPDRALKVIEQDFSFSRDQITSSIEAGQQQEQRSN